MSFKFTWQYREAHMMCYSWAPCCYWPAYKHRQQSLGMRSYPLCTWNRRVLSRPILPTKHEMQNRLGFTTCHMTSIVLLLHFNQITDACCTMYFSSVADLIVCRICSRFIKAECNIWWNKRDHEHLQVYSVDRFSQPVNDYLFNLNNKIKISLSGAVYWT